MHLTLGQAKPIPKARVAITMRSFVDSWENDIGIRVDFDAVAVNAIIVTQWGGRGGRVHELYPA